MYECARKPYFKQPNMRCETLVVSNPLYLARNIHAVEKVQRHALRLALDKKKNEGNVE